MTFGEIQYAYAPLTECLFYGVFLVLVIICAEDARFAGVRGTFKVVAENAAVVLALCHKDYERRGAGYICGAL